MYAVIKTGGKQYKVAEGQTLQVELLGREVGETVSFSPVLVVNGSTVLAGAEANAATVTATIVGSTKGPKITGYMYKSKARVQKKWGHRQNYSTVTVTGITA
jgi:large subunit ribosomal protein L21